MFNRIATTLGGLALGAASQFIALETSNREEPKGEKVLTVLGTGGCMGAHSLDAATIYGNTCAGARRGEVPYDRIIALTGNPEKAQAKLSEISHSVAPLDKRIQYTKLEHNPTEDQVAKAIESQIPGKVSKLHVINGVGGTPESQKVRAGYTEKEIHDLNYTPALTLAKGSLAAAKTKQPSEYRFAQISSHAAGTRGCYGQIRQKTEDDLFKLVHNSSSNKMDARAFSERIGFVMEKPISIEGEEHHYTLKEFYPWSPAQLSHIPFGVVMNSGEEYLCPITSEDAVDGALGGLNHPSIKREGEAIIAASSEKFTQKEWMTYFHSQEKLPILHVPSRLLRDFTHLGSQGRLQEYPTYYVEDKPELDGARFEEVLGHKATTMADIYKKDPDAVIEMPKPEIGKFAMGVAKNAVEHPDRAAKVVGTTASALVHGEFSVSMHETEAGKAAKAKR